ncbi:hypothetical protein RND81_01G148500 [Saponaria officinalis]|uniref:WPP domain-containing protein n=1 Tax=Saponaria officinalis TaxID=3572 RepID=A0AAW1NA04_SAPOF
MTTKPEHCQFSVKLWPPSQNTRISLVDQMTKNLSIITEFTKRYGSMSKEEAEENAKQIEEEAYNVAAQHYENNLIFETLKRGAIIKAMKDMAITEVVPEIVFDISKGPRTFIEAEEADYTKICFSNRSFGLGAARVAEPILVSIKDKLKSVDLSDFIAGRPEAEALEVMSMFSAALEGSKGVRAFGSLLKSQSSLEELYLMNDEISKDAARALSELLPSTEMLKVLHFHKNMTGDGGALAITEVVKRSPLLEDFRCSSTRVDADGGVALSNALAECRELKKLDLRDNMFGTEAGVVLKVYLSYLNLEDKGVTAISRALQYSAPFLEMLELAGNDIKPAAARDVAACLARKKKLCKLNLAENELKDKGAIVIGKCLEDGHTKLTELDMNTNGIRRAGARLLAQAVVGKPDFKLLNLDGNYISDDDIDDINDIFKKCPEKLGPLDENDPEGRDEDENWSEEEGSNDDDDDDEELELKMIKNEETLLT